MINKKKSSYPFNPFTMSETMSTFLSPKQLAEAIGSSESSLKRWADDGLLEVSRTAGGHRRIALNEAIRYIRDNRLPILKPELLGLSDLAAAPERDPNPYAALTHALTEGHAETFRGILISLYLSGHSIAALCDGPIASAMHAVGELWKHGPEGIAIEHRALDLCTQALNQLQSLFPTPPKTAPLALGGAPEGDPYTLPSLMAAAVLGSLKWRTINLGANLPTAALLAAAKQHRPTLVWISCSVEEAAQKNERQLKAAAKSLAQKNIKTLIGGRAWTAPPLDPTLTPVHTMSEFSAYATGLRAAR
jgi:methanogenic corrinoid protein MtbC1